MPAASGIALTLGLTVVLFAGALYLWYAGSPADMPGPVVVRPLRNVVGLSATDKVDRFRSSDEFSDWLFRSDALTEGYGMLGGFAARTMAVEEMAVAAPTMDGAVDFDMKAEAGRGGGAEPERYSETNVQVMGIDEPDILKTDGQEIYYAPQGVRPYPVFRMMEDAIEPKMAFAPDYETPAISLISAFPPDEMELDSEIEPSGEMLLHDGTLVVLAQDGMQAYDVSDPSEPDKTWNVAYERDSWPVASRLSGGSVYTILRDGIDRFRPCPFVPAVLEDGKTDVEIACSDIWHPVDPVPSEVTYTVLKLDAATGELQGQASFVGTYRSTVYMSSGSLYVTNLFPANTFDFVAGFLSDNDDLFPNEVIDRVRKVASYDISQQARMIELQDALERWMRTVDEDDQLKIANEMENRMEDWFSDNVRNLQSTGIVRVDASSLEVVAAGEVPGSLLNQFSLDEHEGYLRVATTVGERGGSLWQVGLGGIGESENDVYVLDDRLKVVSSVQGMGLDERIYSVRFLGDLGYLVTFRQIDPFYVLDLSNPKAPEVKGELKIPGYSSYLHPMPDGSVLGIGKEDSQVKVSLFDVSDPENPVEADKYLLDEYWSDLLNTHHAFLLDAEHEIFFLPGGKGGYVFSYAEGELELVKAVSGLTARRALYIDDYLYVAGDEEIVVLDMEDWERVEEFEL